MSPGPSASLRGRLLLVIVAPLTVVLALASGLPARLLGLDRAVDLTARSERIVEGFQSLLQDAAALADAALVSFPPAPADLPARSPLAGRLEGSALLDGDRVFLAWDGVPAEPPHGFTEPASPRWWVRVDGVRTRLITRAGPDGDGWYSLVSFLFDSSVDDDRRFDGLLSPGQLRGVDLEVLFGDPVRLTGTVDAQDATATSVALRDPEGNVVGRLTLRAVAASHRSARLGEAGRALAVALAVLLAAALFDWPRRIRRPGGAGLACLVVLAGRALLIVSRAPAMLLPRDLGGAGVYGSVEAWGLLASPADLVLSGLALYLICLALRSACTSSAASNRPTGRLLLAAASLVVGLALAAVSVSVAHHTSGPLPGNPLGWSRAPNLLLSIGLVLMALGCAELVVPLLASTRRRSPLAVALVAALLAGGSSAVLQLLDQRLALERLAVEVAPQIFEQGLRREIALRAALAGIQEAYADPETARELQSYPDEQLAYHAWVRGELFHAGTKSSLAFYNTSGALFSEFRYDLPPVDEEIPAVGPDADAEIRIRLEEFDPVPALSQSLLHGEVTILRNGEPIGRVVGHVLDDAENLPFLPGSRSYLAALGPGVRAEPGDLFDDGPHYVLYDGQGAALLSTLPQPPAESESLRLAAARQTPLHVRAGSRRFAGLALGERDRLHLLLIPEPGPIQRLAAALRLGLFALALLVLVELVPRLARPAWLAEALRGSIHRKLLAALLAASVVPLVGLSLFLRGYMQTRGNAELEDFAVQYVGSARRVVEDYLAALPGGSGLELNDSLLGWMSRVIGRDIHVYENGLLVASSRSELFASGLLLPRLDGRVHRDLVLEGRQSLVLPTALGQARIPVAYASVRGVSATRGLVVAVPLVLEPRQIAREVAEVGEMILLATVLLVALLAVAATALARTVARPVRELVDATGRIAAGDYATRVHPRTSDELAGLAEGFNVMAGSLGEQRADLERQRDYVQALLRHATTGVLSTDADGRIVTLNPAARELLRSAGPALEVDSMLDAALEGSAELAPIARALVVEPARAGEAVEVDLPSDASRRRFRIVRVPLPGPSGISVGTLVLLDDVTDLMRSNQLAAWAEMARAIAHEIKNPLTPIQLSTEHMRRLLQDRGLLPAPDLETCLDTVIKQVRELYSIAGEFSAYARLPDLKPEPLDPIEFVRDTIQPYRAAASRSVTVEEHYEAVPQVAIDRRVLSRAIVNLIENALQAMPGGGTLSVEVAPADNGDAVVLSVCDTGIGLSAEAQRRLFEPYFSTKSSGTGLGLAIARRAVEAHHGRIEVDSEPGRGTRFRILLPAAPGA